MSGLKGAWVCNFIMVIFFPCYTFFQGKDLLTDTYGYSYTIKPPKKNRPLPSYTLWRCSDRRCSVTVKQEDDVFTTGLHTSHTHPAPVGRQKALEIIAKAKQKGKEEVLR